MSQSCYIIASRMDSNPETGEKGGYVLATRQLFAAREAAEHRAAAYAPSREPVVIEITKEQLASLRVPEEGGTHARS
ncbi:MAG: hypothetical protein P1V51_20185 [Deltaproteobacteria bacterium]|nr:hypothetical protein [Deltaproteobacteria bacterium]